MKENNRTLIYILMILSFEKFIQHMVVSYAFLNDVSGIRNSVVVDYRYLVISGLIVGFLFLIDIPFIYRRKPFSFILLFFLALFDFIGEFIAQGTILIDITVSFIVASIIIILLISYRKRLA